MQKSWNMSSNLRQITREFGGAGDLPPRQFFVDGGNHKQIDLLVVLCIMGGHSARVGHDVYIVAIRRSRVWRHKRISH